MFPDKNPDDPLDSEFLRVAAFMHGNDRKFGKADKRQNYFLEIHYKLFNTVSAE